MICRERYQIDIENPLMFDDFNNVGGYEKYEGHGRFSHFSQFSHLSRPDSSKGMRRGGAAREPGRPKQSSLCTSRHSQGQRLTKRRNRRTPS